MNFFRRLFGSKNEMLRGTASSPQEQVRALERQAENAPLGTRATLLNRAGDIYMRLGEHEKALEYFRQAIDLLIEDEQPEPARGVAKKIIRVHPNTVRTHCTLTWLDLATGQHAGAIRSLKEYAQAARERGMEDTAAGQIVEMARISAHRGFLEDAAEVLGTLGYPQDADLVAEWAVLGGSEESKADREERNRRCMAGALASKGPPPGRRSTA